MDNLLGIARNHCTGYRSRFAFALFTRWCSLYGAKSLSKLVGALQQSPKVTRLETWLTMSI